MVQQVAQEGDLAVKEGVEEEERSTKRKERYYKL